MKLCFKNDEIAAWIVLKCAQCAYTQFILCLNSKFTKKLFSAGIPNISLTMYPFSISTDEQLPLKCLTTKRLSKITKIH